MVPQPTPEEEAACKVVALVRKTVGSEGVLVSEVPFAKQTRRADLVILDSRSYGIEIKSNRDDVYSALAQLDDYLQTFDFTVLASSSNQIKKIHKKISRYVGLIEIRNGVAEWRRRPLLRKQKNALYLASWLDRRSIILLCQTEGLLTTNTRNMTIEELREYLAKKLSIGVIQQQAIARLRQRALSSYRHFNDEVGEVCLPEDWVNLRYKEPITRHLASS